MIKKLKFLLFFLLSGCISNAQETNIREKLETPEKFNLKPDDIYKLMLKNAYKHQVKLSYSVDNTTFTGMAVPVSANKLITAAHVVSEVKVDGYVNVIYKEGINKMESSYKAIIKNINIQNDSATLEIVDGELPISSIPQLCTYQPGNIIAGAKLSGVNGDLTAFSMFNGVLAYYNKMPIVSDQYNERAKIGGYPPLQMAEQNKIVGILSFDAIGGNSGGAIFDLERGSCVIGIASLVVRVKELRRPSKMAKRLSIPKDEPFPNDKQLIIGIPIDEYHR